MKKFVLTCLIVLLIFGGAWAEKKVHVQMESDDATEPIVKVKKIVMYTDLDLTPEQEKQFKQIKLDFEQQELPWKQKIETKELEFKAELLKDNPNKQTLYAIVDEVSRYRAELLKKDIDRKYALRQVLTDEQKENWDNGPGKISLDFGGTGIHHVSDDKMIWISNDEDLDMDVMPGKKHVVIKHKADE